MKTKRRGYRKELEVKNDLGSLQTQEFNFEMKSSYSDDEFFYFEGYASTFNDVDNHDDMVVRGAFVDSLQIKMPVMLWQHDQTMPIGVYMEAREDEHGLYVKGKMPKEDTFVCGRVMPQMKVGSVRKMSIGYYAIEREYKGDIRVLKKVMLEEISLVTLPSNENADVVSMKSLKDVLQTCKDRSTISDEQHREIKSFIAGYCKDEGMLNPLETKKINVNDVFNVSNSSEFEELSLIHI